MSKREASFDAKAKRERACELRLAGATYVQIARELGYASHTSAMRAVDQGMATRISESAEQVRTQELARLDALLLGLWPAARKGDTAAVDRVLRVMERRAHYLGLDASRSGLLSGTSSEGSPVDDLSARRAARRSAAASQ